MGIDDLQKLIEADEQADRLSLVENPKMAPIEYARLRGLRPQAVYRMLRIGKLVWDTCDCGRRVVVVSEADEVFNKGVNRDQDGQRLADGSNEPLPEDPPSEEG